MSSTVRLECFYLLKFDEYIILLLIWDHLIYHASHITLAGGVEPAFASHLLGSLGRGASSCRELQEAAASVVVETGGACSHYPAILIYTFDFF